MSDKQTVILVPVKPKTTDLSIKNDRVIFVPLATKDSFGVVKVGDGLLIADGLLSFDHTNFEQSYLDKKLDKFQGIDNSGKILYVGLDGNISLRDSEYKGISIKEDDSLISSDTLTLNFKDSFDVTSTGTETSINLKDIYVKKFNYSEFKEFEALGSDSWILSDRDKEIVIGDLDFTGTSVIYNNTIQINRTGILARSIKDSSGAYSMINWRSSGLNLNYVSNTGNAFGISINSNGCLVNGDNIITESYLSSDDLIYLSENKIKFNTDKLIEDLNNYDSYTLANNNISLQHTGSDSGNGSTQFLLRRNDSELYLVSSEDSSGSKLGLYFNGFDVGVEYMNGNVNLLTDTVYWNGQPLALDGINNVDTDMIVDGAITTSKISDGAVTDIKIASVSGTKVSGVVRTTQQTLTDTEKQQAQTNITHTATQNHAVSGVQAGWFQVANLKTNGNYDIKIKQTYNYNPPEAIHLSISINHRLSTAEPFASITQLSGVRPTAYSITKIRVRQGTDEGTTFFDVYNPNQLWNTTWVDITSDSRDVVVEPNSPFQFIGTEDNPSGYKISSLDLVTGLNVNSDVTINGNLTSLSTEATPVNYIAVSKQYTIEGPSATQDINVNSKISPSIIDLSVEGTLTNASGTTITANAVRIDPSSMRISGNPFSFSIKSSADDSYSRAASISTNGVFNFYETPTVNSAPVFVATTPNWVAGTSGSLTLPGAGWYILYGNYSYTGIVWWSPQDPNGEQVTTGYIALNNNIAISTSGVVSLLNAPSGVTVYYYKIG